MANIFSGVLGGGSPSSGNSALDRIKYQQEMDEYEERRQAEKQAFALKQTRGSFDASIADMSPEMQRQALMFRDQAGHSVLFDKAREGSGNVHKSSSTNLLDIMKQDRTLQRNKDLIDYENANPEPGENYNAKIEQRNDFIEKWRADERNDTKLIAQRGYGATDAELARMSDREEKILNLGDQFISNVTGSVTEQRLLQADITKAAAANYGPRLVNFQASVDDSEDLLAFTHNRMNDIAQLHEQTDGWTTGILGLLGKLNPVSDAAEWERLKETIVSNIGLDKIMSLKAGSAQGATGLGALNEKELEMLQNYAGNLKSASSAGEIKKILRRLQRDLKSSQMRIMRALPKEMTFYNDYQQYLPNRGRDTPDYAPSDFQKNLFSGGDYQHPEIETNLSETRQERLDRLLAPKVQ